jgi:glycosyltransferase involved in cell wall biosynthesis
MESSANVAQIGASGTVPGRMVCLSTMHSCGDFAPGTIATLASQSRTAWRAIFIDDVSEDGTADVVESVAGELGIADRLTLIRHEERRYKTRNVVDAVREHVGDDEIVVMLDGDDWLASDRALEILAREYAAGWDVVWGNWVGSDGTRGTSWHLNPFLPVRRQPWVTSHLFSFRARLLKDVPDGEFKDDEGNWFRAACDQAIALPVLERAVRRKHVEEVLYVYNRANPHSHDKQGRLVNPLVSDAQAAASAILYSRAAISPPWDHEFCARHRFEFVHAAMASAGRYGGDAARRHAQQQLALLTTRSQSTPD